MSGADPISQFFPGHEDDDDVLYTALGVPKDAPLTDITKAYRKAALRHHPDKHAGATDAAKAAEAAVFQQVGFAYGVLKDEGRRKRYDSTGRTDDASLLEAGAAAGWQAYFEDVFERVTRSKLDEVKASYQGSDEERADVLAAYKTSGGALDEILANVMCATTADVPRLVALVNGAIAARELKATGLWRSSSTDEAAAKKRAAGDRAEAAEAEAHARELGVWDEFYGSGKPTAQKSKKGAAEPSADDDAEFAGLKALMLKRKAGAADPLEALAAKYAAKPKPKKAGKKAKAQAADDENDAPADEMDDETFARLQKEVGERAAAAKREREADGAGTGAGASKKRARARK